MYDADPPEPARARAAARTCRQLPSSPTRGPAGDGVGRDACQALLMKHCLHSLESFNQPVVSRLLLVWLSSKSIWLCPRVLLEHGQFLVGQGLTRRRAATVCDSLVDSFARSHVGNPLGYEVGLCTISSSVAVSTPGILGRLFTRRSISKE